MSRQPDETVAQWYERAAVAYQDALKALEVESTRLGLDRWRSSQTRPKLDARYYAAMDNVDSAEDERMDAATAMVRERNYSG
jgi:hypothetical protein